ncbi:MAG: hypothetical protein VW338_14945 [Rhodospirillaceae bacterium]
MCEPVTISSTTLAYASIAASAVSTVVGAVGSIQQGRAAQAQANYQAQVARNNKIVADRQAADALERGKVSELNYRREVSRLAGRQKAVLAGNGVVVDQGSALDILGDTAELGELDALTIRSNAEREAYGYRVQGNNFEADARLAQARGSAAASAGTFGAITGLLSGAGSVANKWYGFQKEKVPGFY